MMHIIDGRRRVVLLVAAAVVAGIAASAAQAPPVAAPPTAVSADRLMQTVRTLASEEFQGRASGTAGGAKARAFVRDRFEAIRLQTIGGAFEQAFTFTRKTAPAGGAAPVTVEAANLVGRCPGQDPTRSVLVLSAHYDHLGVRDGKMYPGADDNASGVAALLEIAAQCLAQPFSRDLIVVAFDAEEGGLNGARAFVASEIQPKDRIAANINLDMVARGDKGEIYIAGTQHTPALRPLLEPVAARAPIRVRFGHDQPGSGHDDWTLQSDHGVFHQAGIPFVYFGVEDHPDYHQPTDTADKINPDFFAHAVGVVLESLRALDRGLR